MWEGKGSDMLLLISPPKPKAYAFVLCSWQWQDTWATQRVIYISRSQLSFNFNIFSLSEEKVFFLTNNIQRKKIFLYMIIGLTLSFSIPTNATSSICSYRWSVESELHFVRRLCFSSWNPEYLSSFHTFEFQTWGVQLAKEAAPVLKATSHSLEFIDNANTHLSFSG